MSEFKKVSIFETIGRKVYSDQYGLVNNNGISISIFDNITNQWYNDASVFIKTNGKYETLRDKYQTFDITKIFSKKLYIFNSSYRNNYYYGYRNHVSVPQNDEQAKDIKFSTIKISFGNLSVQVNKIDKQAFNIEVWVAENDNWEMYRVKYHQLRKGDLVYYEDLKCTCIVDQILEPNPQGELCVIKSLKDDATHAIKSDNRNLYWVPYIEHKGELAIFNEMKNEPALSPFVLEERISSQFGNTPTRNIFWQPVNEASQYIVSVYKYYHDSNDCNNRLYHMANYTVDRNTYFLIIKDLVDEKFIFTVAAENRSGEIIAKSRGIIDEGKPQFWKET